MTNSALDKLLPAGMIAWLVVGGAGTIMMIDDGDDWHLRYVVFSIALLTGASILFAAGVLVTQGTPRRVGRIAGLVVLGMGLLVSLAAWAIPVWMMLLGAGFCVLAFVEPAHRREFATFAAAQIGGLGVFLGATELEIGRVDEHGDYPVAGALGVSFTSAITVVALGALWRAIAHEPAPRRSTVSAG